MHPDRKMSWDIYPASGTQYTYAVQSSWTARPISPRRPFHPPAAKDVKMQMVDCLSPVAVTVHHEPVATLGNAFSLGKFFGSKEEPGQQLYIFIIQIVQRADVFPRDKERVNRRLWVEVIEADDVLVIMKDFCRDFSFCNAAKNARHIFLLL